MPTNPSGSISTVVQDLKDHPGNSIMCYKTYEVFKGLDHLPRGLSTLD